MVFNAAVIGCGNMGSEYDKGGSGKFPLSHAGAYSANRQTNLTAVCDINRRKMLKAKKKWNTKSGYTDYKEMLDKEKIDILSIASSTPSHLGILKEALRGDLKAIFLEKPVSENLTEAEKLKKEIKKSGIKVAVNYRHRWNPAMIELKRRFDEGVFGRLQKINAFYTKGMIHIGSHSIHLMNWFFGDPLSVTSLTKLRVDAPDAVIDACFAMKGGFNFYLQGFDKEFQHL